MKKLILSLALSFLCLHAIKIPKDVKQLLKVSSSHASQNQALLYTYERRSSTEKWKAVFNAIPVTLGRNGLGLGFGLNQKAFNQNSTLPLKFEGDGRSPAGIFRLSHIFGYALPSPNQKMPYIHATKKLHCVDDSNSPYYNQILKQRSGYTSFESMRRNDNLYEFGIVVEHNTKAIKQRGSCIFIHIARDDKSPTAGCTAMSKEALLRIIEWLDSSKQPTLLQNII